MKPLTSSAILTIAAALTACASQPPAPAAGTGAPHQMAPVTAATSASPGTVPATASAAPQKAKFTVPDGYDEVIVKGQKLYCRTEAETGTRITTRVCHTQAQLQAMQDSSQQFLQDVQRAGGTMPGKMCGSGTAAC